MKKQSKQFPKRLQDYGNLWYDGKLILANRRFTILQAKKKELLATGRFVKEKFKLTY